MTFFIGIGLVLLGMLTMLVLAFAIRKRNHWSSDGLNALRKIPRHRAASAGSPNPPQPETRPFGGEHSALRTGNKDSADATHTVSPQPSRTLAGTSPLQPTPDVRGTMSLSEYAAISSTSEIDARSADDDEIAGATTNPRQPEPKVTGTILISDPASLPRESRLAVMPVIGEETKSLAAAAHSHRLAVLRITDKEHLEIAATDQAILIGSSSEAMVMVPGDPMQAAIVFSDGVALVTRLGAGRLRLGNVEIGPVGVPITASTNQLLLDHALLDVSSFQRRAPAYSVLIRWITAVVPAGSAQTRSCVSAAFGPSGQALSAQAVSCFSGAGRRAAVWALEAGFSVEETKVMGCVVGIAEVEGVHTILVAAQAAALEVLLEPTSESLVVTHERGDLHTAELPIAGLAAPSEEGVWATRLTLRLLDEAGALLLEGRLPLQPIWQEFATNMSATASSAVGRLALIAAPSDLARH